MKRIVCLICTLCLLFSMSLPVFAREYTTKEYEGVTYIDITAKADLDAIVMDTWAAREESVNVCYTVENIDWPEKGYINIPSFSQYDTKAHFTSLQYSADIVWFQPAEKDWRPLIVDGVAYGAIGIMYIDSQEEIAKADALIKQILNKIASYSLYDKLLYIADYICAATEYGSQKMPDGGYDVINGAYDVLTGVRTNTVCSSYAITFQRFMEVLGMESYILSNRYHAWNVVKIDGSWYGIDCTADDGDTIRRQNFLMGLPTMKAFYAIDRLDPFTLFGKEHTFAAADYGKTVATTKRTTTAPVTKKPTVAKPTTAKPQAAIVTTTATTTTATVAATDTSPTAQATTTAPTVGTTTTTSPETATADNSNQTIWIAVGAVAAIALATSCVLLLRRKRNV